MKNMVHYQCKGCGKTASMTPGAFKWRCENMSRPQYCGLQCMATNLHTFLPRLDMSGGADACWDWQGARSNRGYGLATFHNKPIWASRLSWILHNGPPPKGMYVCHRCDRPPCCNPKHLFLGSVEDNNRDMRQKGRHVFGERSPGALLKFADVVSIRNEPRVRGSGVRLAKKYGVSPATISSIRVGRNWASPNGDYTIFGEGGVA